MPYGVLSARQAACSQEQVRSFFTKNRDRVRSTVARMRRREAGQGAVPASAHASGQSRVSAPGTAPGALPGPPTPTLGCVLPPPPGVEAV